MKTLRGHMLGARNRRVTTHMSTDFLPRSEDSSRRFEGLAVAVDEVAIAVADRAEMIVAVVAVAVDLVQETVTNS